MLTRLRQNQVHLHRPLMKLMVSTGRIVEVPATLTGGAGPVIGLVDCGHLFKPGRLVCCHLLDSSSCLKWPAMVATTNHGLRLNHFEGHFGVVGVQYDRLLAQVGIVGKRDIAPHGRPNEARRGSGNSV